MYLYFKKEKKNGKIKDSKGNKWRDEMDKGKKKRENIIWKCFGFIFFIFLSILISFGLIVGVCI